MPAVLLVQARIAARNGVSLDTVLRRYFAGYALLGDFVLEEAQEKGLLQGEPLKRLLRAQAARFDRLLAAVSEEHVRETEERPTSTEELRGELVERLLAGERLDASELAYDFEAIHLGLIAVGPGAEDAIRELASSLDRIPLLIRREEQTLWAWLGGRRAVERNDLELLLTSILPPQISLAIGEPAEGPGGWRLTHQQAKAAMPIAVRSPEPFVRYADVALLASMLQDGLLATSLRRLYLKPLEADRDGGEVARETLRAYFAAGRNTASTAAMLGVNRKTVASRLRRIEALIGCPLSDRTAEIEATLQVEAAGDTNPAIA